MAEPHLERDPDDDGSPDPSTARRPHAPTRGLLVAIALSLAFWAVVGLAVWVALR